MSTSAVAGAAGNNPVSSDVISPVNSATDNIFLNESTQHTVKPSGRQQSIRTLLQSLSSSSSTQPRFALDSFPHASRRFLEDLALRSRNKFRSERRVFSDMSDGVAFLLMGLNVAIWGVLTLCFIDKETLSLCSNTVFTLLKIGPLFLSISISIAFISSIFLYLVPRFTVHSVSLSVLLFTLYTASFNLPQLKFNYGNFASLLTFTFLLLYYLKGLKHLPLTFKFIKSASRICWRNHVSLGFVFFSYALFIYIYLITWSLSILIIQNTKKITVPYAKASILCYFLLSLLLFGSFLRDLLQIWLSRIIYTSTFAYPSKPVVVTSLLKRDPVAQDCEFPGSFSDSPTYEETQRVVSRESMWWCMGTASRSAFHLVLRAFQVHTWILSLVQIYFPNFGSPADPKCVLDVFHVPTAIYGTSFTKSRRFVADTMVNHGMDQISVDLYLRIFIYYMISYACFVLSLLSVWALLGSDYRFKISFIVDFTWSIFTTSSPVHFACIFVASGTILYFTAIDSVHMILCWSICETPTSVSSLEPELMHTLVTNYHARLDLNRFSGDRIRTSR